MCLYGFSLTWLQPSWVVATMITQIYFPWRVFQHKQTKPWVCCVELYHWSLASLVTGTYLTSLILPWEKPGTFWLRWSHFCPSYPNWKDLPVLLPNCTLYSPGLTCLFSQSHGILWLVLIHWTWFFWNSVPPSSCVGNLSPNSCANGVGGWILQR
jgi:hypothetical protein